MGMPVPPPPNNHVIFWNDNTGPYWNENTGLYWNDNAGPYLDDDRSNRGHLIRNYRIHLRALIQLVDGGFNSCRSPDMRKKSRIFITGKRAERAKKKAERQALKWKIKASRRNRKSNNHHQHKNYSSRQLTGRVQNHRRR